MLNARLYTSHGRYTAITIAIVNRSSFSYDASSLARLCSSSMLRTELSSFQVLAFWDHVINYNDKYIMMSIALIFDLPPYTYIKYVLHTLQLWSLVKGTAADNIIAECGNDSVFFSFHLFRWLDNELCCELCMSSSSSTFE